MAHPIVSRLVAGALTISTIQCVRYTNQLALDTYPTNFKQLSTTEKCGEYFRHGYLVSCGVILGLTTPIWLPPAIALDSISKNRVYNKLK